MEIKFTPFLLLLSVVLSSCSSDISQIRVACDNSSPEVYTVKWELFPSVNGNVKIYSSYDPENFNGAVLEKEKSISQGFCVIRREDKRRRFFRLDFDKNHSAYAGERYIHTDRIEDLRDLGGYFRGKNRQVKWAKLYRSGNLSWMSSNDKLTLDSLHVKTILDLRSERVRLKSPSRYKAEETINLNLHMVSMDSIRQKILDGQMKKGDVLIMLQDMYAQILEKDTASLAKAFDILADTTKYPILFHCYLGKDHTGLLSILILEALGVDGEQIFYDYMLSNQYIDFSRIISKTNELPPEAEEPLTTLLSANEHLYNFVYDKVRREYGSMQQYLSKALRVTDKKREKLRANLLYQ